MIYIKLSFIITSISIIFKNIYFTLTIFQQEHYDPKKLLKSLFSFYFKKKYNYILYLLFLISITNNIYLYILGMIFSLIGLFLKEKYIIKLKITKRIIRLLITYFLTMILLILVIPKEIHLETLLLTFIINPFYLIFINYINLPLELIIKKHYKKKAKIKLENHPNLCKISITGSYGKTSTKNILTKILENKYICLKTPKSYNTIMGISKVINTDLNSTTEIFITEMGAYRINEIKEMTKMIKPSIGIITDVGYQHMDTFKTIENVVKAKTELADYIEENNLMIINGDNEYLKNRQYKTRTIFYGFNEENEILAKNIKIENGIMTFDIYQNSEFILEIKTKLLGMHNIKNILACFGVIKNLEKYNINITNQEFQKTISTITPIKHRLSYEKIDNIHIYDDSYNSNLVGFKNSIDVLKKVPLKKVIITPGIVDCGKMTKEINEKIAVEIEKVFNDIYLIDNYSSKFIYKKISKDKNIKLCPSFKDAYLEVLSKYKKEEICLLIENDLPDNFLNRRK